MRRLPCLAAVCIIFFFVSSLSATSDRSIRRGSDGRQRTALVIGNSKYQSAPLKNPVNREK